MDVPLLLSKAQMRRIEPFFPLSHGIPRFDDRRIVSGIAGRIVNEHQQRTLRAAILEPPVL